MFISPGFEYCSLWIHFMHVWLMKQLKPSQAIQAYPYLPSENICTVSFARKGPFVPKFKCVLNISFHLFQEF